MAKAFDLPFDESKSLGNGTQETIPAKAVDLHHKKISKPLGNETYMEHSSYKMLVSPY